MKIVSRRISSRVVYATAMLAATVAHQQWKRSGQLDTMVLSASVEDYHHPRSPPKKPPR